MSAHSAGQLEDRGRVGNGHHCPGAGQDALRQSGPGPDVRVRVRAEANMQLGVSMKISATDLGVLLSHSHLSARVLRCSLLAAYRIRTAGSARCGRQRRLPARALAS